MNNSWIRVFPSHLFPSIKLPESNSENNSLLCVNSLLYFSTFREKLIQVYVPQNSRVPQNIQKQFLHHNFLREASNPKLIGVPYSQLSSFYGKLLTFLLFSYLAATGWDVGDFWWASKIQFAKE